MIKELNSEMFHGAVETPQFAVVDCYGDFCYACELLAPVFDSIAERMPGIEFMRINVTQNPEIQMELEIFDLPTILFYRNGKIVHKEIGSIDEDTFKAALCKMLYPENLGKEPKVRLNSDPAVVAQVREGLRRRKGFCPCRAEDKPEYKCMCEEFKAQIADPDFEGYCHCKLYYKEK